MKKKPTRRSKNFGLSNQGEVVINLPPLDPNRTYRIYSPRLKHLERAKDFCIEMEELPSSDVKAR